jgi:hypothetical protein
MERDRRIVKRQNRDILKIFRMGRNWAIGDGAGETR